MTPTARIATCPTCDRDWDLGPTDRPGDECDPCDAWRFVLSTDPDPLTAAIGHLSGMEAESDG